MMMNVHMIFMVRREKPVRKCEMMEKDKKFELGQLTAWTRVDTISKRHVCVWSRWHLHHHIKPNSKSLVTL